MSFDTAVTARGLGKRYEIYAQPKDRLKQMVVAGVRRMFKAAPPAYFKEFWALSDVNFDIAKGETVAIIGQNGSGKSTLLQTVCGIINPTRGSVSVNGRVAALLELGAGFNPEFTGAENVYLSGLLYGISEAELAKRFDSIVAFSEIGEFINQPVKMYSSGMYVRLAFAIAAHVDADILIVDEALSVGDVRFTQKCMRFIREFQKTGTLLFVSHDVSAVMSLCSRAIWLSKGNVRMDGVSKDVVEAYLAEQHAADQGALGVKLTVTDRSKTDKDKSPDKGPEKKDRGADDFSARGVGTRLEVFEFDPDAAGSEFGTRGATISDVAILDESGQALKITYGGELVDLRITAQVNQPLNNLIFGFYLKDRLGQHLFGDNTYLTTLGKELHASTGKTYTASFKFRMPVLPVGAYAIDVALASGSQSDHVQHHWIHDAMALRATDSSMRHGLVGIPMLDIEISEES